MNKKEQNKILIPLIRKHLPNAIAKDILGVQPMTQATSEIFTLRTLLKSPWTAWQKAWVFWPKRSINGKLIFGKINVSKSFLFDSDGETAKKDQIECRYATDKEIFVEKLKGKE